MSGSGLEQVRRPLENNNLRPQRKTKTKEVKDAKGMSGHARYVAYREIRELLKQKQKKVRLAGGCAQK